jgi:hypothetical protein
MDMIANERSDRYWQAATAAADWLDERLAAIRRHYDNGEISVTEAAEERVQVLEEHIARLRALRREYLTS